MTPELGNERGWLDWFANGWWELRNEGVGREGKVRGIRGIWRLTTGPNVHRLAVGLLLDHFRRQVARRARKPVPRIQLALNLNGESEVSQLDGRSLGLARQEQILRLEVSVHDVVHVTVIDRLEDLLDAVGRVRLAVILASHDVLEQLAASDQVEYEIVVGLFLDGIM